MTPTHIQIRKLSKTYQSASGDAVAALREIDLDIRRGEFLSIVGPSGCGKSTLLNIIAGFELPTSGEVRMGESVVNRPGADRGVVFQSYALFPWLTVAGNIAFGPQSRGLPAATVRERVAHCVELVKLTGFESKFPNELSGGMQQRCALARCIANDPEVMLMDEPLAALDALTRESLQDELIQIWATASRSQSKTAVYITHSIDEAIFLSDRIVVMSRLPGQIREIIAVPFARPRNGEVRLDAAFHQLRDRIWLMLRDITKAKHEETRS